MAARSQCAFTLWLGDARNASEPIHRVPLLALAVAIVTTGQTAETQNCPLPTKTLTYQWNTKCDDGVPGWFNTTTPETTSKC